MKTYHVVSAVILSPDDEVLLVRQSRWDRRDNQATGTDDDYVWSFPGGKIDPGETREAALIREIQEETGLTITADHMTPISRCQYVRTSGHYAPSCCDVHLYVVRTMERPPADIADPCGFVLAARFFPRAEALEQIARIPWRSMREPLEEYLKGNHTTQNWYYEFTDDHRAEPITEDQFAAMRDAQPGGGAE